MVNPQVSLLDLTADAGILCDMMRKFIGSNNIVSVLRHDGLLVDMVKEGIEEDSNTNCDEVSNKHMTRIRLQHVTRVNIQYMTMIRIQHVTSI